MIPPRSSLLVLLVAASVSSAACGGRQSPAPDGAYTDPYNVFEAMLTRLEFIDSVRMRTSVEYYGEGGRARGEQAVLARAPADLRVETITPFGTSLSLFLVADGSLVFYDLEERVYVTGPPTPSNISRFVPFWMSADDLVRVLFGGPPLDAVEPEPYDYTLSWDGDADAYRLELPLVDGGTLVLRVRHDSWVVTNARRFDSEGHRVFELRAGEFETVSTEAGEVRMPRRLRFLMEEEGLDISLEVERLDVNVELQDALFELDPPAGAEVRVLD